LTPFPDKVACRCGAGQYAILSVKECQFEATGSPRLFIDTAQIVLDHLLLGAQAKRNLSEPLCCLMGRPVAGMATPEMMSVLSLSVPSGFAGWVVEII
jgi:hypothetical protein